MSNQTQKREKIPWPLWWSLLVTCGYVFIGCNQGKPNPILPNESTPVIALQIDSSGSYVDNLLFARGVPYVVADEVEGALWRVSTFDKRVTTQHEGVIEDSVDLQPLLTAQKISKQKSQKGSKPVSGVTKSSKDPSDSGTFPHIAFQDADQFLRRYPGRPALTLFLWDGEVTGKETDLLAAAQSLAAHKGLRLVAVVGIEPSLRNHVERLLGPIFGSRLVCASEQDRTEVVRRIRQVF
jgi:hypothetical protein